MALDPASNAQPEHPNPSRRGRFTVFLAALAAGASVAAPAVLHLDREAYPTAPEQRQAIDLCSRTDPTFVRFLAGDRARCYEHFSSLAPASRVFIQPAHH